MQRHRGFKLANTFQLGSPHSKAVIYHIHLRTHEEIILFSQVEGDTAYLNEVGRIVADEWQQSASQHKGIVLDSWVVLPDGLRGLVEVQDKALVRPKAAARRSLTSLKNPKPRALNSFIASFKAAAAMRINLVRSEPGAPVWQRGYHEQQVDDDMTLVRVRNLLNQTAGAAEMQVFHHTDA